jgi:hypothetical protein
MEHHQAMPGAATPDLIANVEESSVCSSVDHNKGRDVIGVDEDHVCVHDLLARSAATLAD